MPAGELALDPQLPAQIRAGDAFAFERCFRAMHGPLVAFTARYVGDRARAEEVVQELFLALWRDRETLVVSGSFRAYLYSAARNRALNVRRRDAVERDWTDDEALDGVRVAARHGAKGIGQVRARLSGVFRRLHAAHLENLS
jgi:RNA polymerase sigma-70 factor (ECF subfamily)